MNLWLISSLFIQGSFYKGEPSIACSVNPTLHRTDTGTYAAKAPRQGLNKENGA